MGTELKTGHGGLVRLATDEGTTAELAPETAVRVARGRVVVGSGSVLARSTTGTTITLASGAISATGSRAAFRLGRALSLLVGVYQGRVRVAAPGASAEIESLNEVPISGPTMDVVRPLRIGASSPWDIRFLGDALDLDRELDALRVGFTAQFGPRAPEAPFFRRFIPFPSLAFLEPWLPRFESFDVLAGLLYSALVAIKTQRTLEDTFVRLLALRSRGATWGLVVAGEGIDYTAALKGVFAAVARGTGETPPARPRPSPGPRTGTPSSRPSPTPAPKPMPTASPSPSGSPRPSPSPSPDCGALELLLGRDCVLIS